MSQPCCPGPFVISIKGAGKFEWCHGLNSNECAILIWGSWFGTLSSLRKMPVQRAIVWVCVRCQEQKKKKKWGPRGFMYTRNKRDAPHMEIYAANNSDVFIVKVTRQTSVHRPLGRQDQGRIFPVWTAHSRLCLWVVACSAHNPREAPTISHRSTFTSPSVLMPRPGSSPPTRLLL